MGLSDYWKDKKRGPVAPSAPSAPTGPAAPSAPTGPTLPSSSSMLYPSSRGAGNSSPITAINRSSNGGWNMSDGSISLTASDGSTWNTGRHIQNCFDSNNCASGWACIGGKCAQANSGASGSGGGTSGCGDDADNGDKCGAGDCTKSTCGESGGSPGDDTCCDQQKCCQRGDDGFVRCTCGPCPPPKVNCDAFCAAFYAAYGRRTMGCTEENTCTQCEECRLVESFQPRECVPLEPENANCWCPQNMNDPPEECQKCMATGEWRDDCENCQACYTVNVDCGCAINTTKCCEPGCITSQGMHRCKEKAWQNCYAACTPPDDDEPADPCAGTCYGQHFCDEPVPPCPDGASCTDNGSISAGRTVCDKSNVPPECEECDCHCHNDCKNCEVCGASGECEPDPACEDKYFSQIMVRQRTYWSMCLYFCHQTTSNYGEWNYQGYSIDTVANNSGIVGEDSQLFSYRTLGTQVGERNCPPAPSYSQAVRSQATVDDVDVGSPFYSEGVVGSCPSQYYYFYNEQRYGPVRMYTGYGDTAYDAYQAAYAQIPQPDYCYVCSTEPPW
jgi:hypothetical protein